MAIQQSGPIVWHARETNRLEMFDWYDPPSNGEFIVMDVTVEGNLSTAFGPGYESSNAPHHDPTKKPTFAEKLMGVKNTQCDQFLSRVQHSLSSQEFRNMVKIREDTNKVRYDYKEIDLIKKRRELERKKQRYPYMDTEEDEFELARIERYLFYNPNHCFYMEKKNTIPLRGTAKSDPYHITPTVARARKVLQDLVNDRSVEAIQEKRATMLSRKSTRSVHFQDEADEGEEHESHTVALQRSHSPSRGRSQSPYKRSDSVNQRSRSESPSKARYHSRPKSNYSRVTSQEGVEEVDGCDVTKEEQLLANLRRERAEKDRLVTLLLGDQNEDEEVPDDYTQCAPGPAAASASRQSRHRDRQSRQTPEYADDTNQYTNTSSVPKPSSGYSRRSYGTSNQDAESGVHFPSISGDHKEADEIPESAHFGGLDELPPHEVALLTQAAKHAPYPPQRERPIQSAFVRRSAPTTRSSYRRHTSNSAHSLKRRQYTHAMAREEKADVEHKVNRFLNKFEDDRPKYHRLVRRASQPAFVVKQQQQLQDSSATNGNNGSGPAATDPLQSGTTSPTKSVAWQTMPQTAVPPNQPAKESSAKPRRTQGPPTHSLNRAKRHTPTFKLRKMMDELMKNRTTAQQMEHEKMLAARKNGGKTPDLHSMLHRDSPPGSDTLSVNA